MSAEVPFCYTLYGYLLVPVYHVSVGAYTYSNLNVREISNPENLQRM